MAFLIVIIIIILIIVPWYSYKLGVLNADMNNLRGFYESNKQFNEESGLNSFIFYIGDFCDGSYNTYILLVDSDDKILVNTPSPMTLSRPWFAGELGCYEFKACFSNLDNNFIPNNVKLKFYTRSNKIIISGPDTIYGCLFKNPVLSEMDLIKNELMGDVAHAHKNNNITDIA